MSRFNTAWATALEDAAPVADIDIDINEAPSIDVDEDGAPLEAVDAYGEPTFEAIETEMVEDEAEYEEADSVVEKLDETVAQLESAAVAVENRIANNGGMTSGELEFMMIGLEGRIKNTKSLFPSTESFSNSKLNATNEAKMSLREGIEYVWKALSDAINAVIRKLREWFGTTRKAAAKLKTRAAAIGKAGEALTGKEPKEKKITLSRVSAFVYGGNKFALTGSTAKEQMGLLVDSINDTFALRGTKAWGQYINAYAGVIDDLVKNGASNAWTEAEAITKVTSIDGYESGGYLRTSGQSDVGNRFSGIKAVAGHRLPGDMTIFLQLGPTEGNPTTVEAFESAKGKRGMILAPSTTDKKTTKDSVEFEVLTPKNITDMASYAEEVCDSIMSYEDAWGTRDKAVAKVQADVTAAVKAGKVGKDAEEGEAKRSQVIGVLLRGLTHDIKAAPARDAKLIQYALSSTKDYLLYCTRSIAAYSEGKVPANKESKDEDAPATPAA